jgi:hypothetical protein
MRTSVVIHSDPLCSTLFDLRRHTTDYSTEFPMVTIEEITSECSFNRNLASPRQAE